MRVKGACFEDKVLDGMMNIGVRPTVDGHRKVIEVNIFDFNEEIYEQTITVMVYDYIRGEVKFNGLDALKAQLQEDVNSANTILKGHPLF